MSTITSISETAQVPNRVLADLSSGARRCFSLLASFAARSGQAFPFQRTLAMKLDCNLRTVNRYVRELRDAGILAVRKRQRSSALYSFSQAVEDPAGRPRKPGVKPSGVVSNVVSGPRLKSVGSMSTSERGSPLPPLTIAAREETPAAGASYGEFERAASAAELPESSVDRERARRFFFALTMEERRQAIAGLEARRLAGEFSNPFYRPRPDNYLRNRIWERPIKQKQPKKYRSWNERREQVYKRVREWGLDIEYFMADERGIAPPPEQTWREHLAFWIPKETV
jgi:Helix-turn-helix domain